MPKKPAEEQDPGAVGEVPEARPSVYGGRWGPGPAATPHNQPGSIASDPASAPQPHEDAAAAPGVGASSVVPDADDEGALRKQREQDWDSEGGAASGRNGA